ncbi:hypothetical protein [Actinoplanes sp. NBRC 103695]|uniref:hypothetical protein n=1 Tax=Actinoplanes sp. NBRC 103695 TaxID=3032202 RepID=UPI002555E9E3|nr:hypothetical protein [Actinoplanes sp. NBRC 103695]
MDRFVDNFVSHAGLAQHIDEIRRVVRNEFRELGSKALPDALGEITKYVGRRAGLREDLVSDIAQGFKTRNPVKMAEAADEFRFALRQHRAADPDAVARLHSQPLGDRSLTLAEGRALHGGDERAARKWATARDKEFGALKHDISKFPLRDVQVSNRTPTVRATSVEEVNAKYTAGLKSAERAQSVWRDAAGEYAKAQRHAAALVRELRTGGEQRLSSLESLSPEDAVRFRAQHSAGVKAMFDSTLGRAISSGARPGGAHFHMAERDFADGLRELRRQTIADGVAHHEMIRLQRDIESAYAEATARGVGEADRIAALQRVRETVRIAVGDLMRGNGTRSLGVATVRHWDDLQEKMVGAIRHHFSDAAIAENRALKRATAHIPAAKTEVAVPAAKTDVAAPADRAGEPRSPRLSDDVEVAVLPAADARDAVEAFMRLSPHSLAFVPEETLVRLGTAYVQERYAVEDMPPPADHVVADLLRNAHSLHAVTPEPARVDGLLRDLLKAGGFHVSEVRSGTVVHASRYQAGQDLDVVTAASALAEVPGLRRIVFGAGVDPEAALSVLSPALRPHTVVHAPYLKPAEQAELAERAGITVTMAARPDPVLATRALPIDAAGRVTLPHLAVEWHFRGGDNLRNATPSEFEKLAGRTAHPLSDGGAVEFHHWGVWVRPADVPVEVAFQIRSGIHAHQGDILVGAAGHPVSGPMAAEARAIARRLPGGEGDRITWLGERPVAAEPEISAGARTGENATAMRVRRFGDQFDLDAVHQLILKRARADADLVEINLPTHTSMRWDDGFESVKDSFVADVRAAAERFLGRSTWHDAFDQGGFQRAYDELHGSLAQRLEARALWDSAAGGAKQRVDSLFDTHARMSDRAALFGERGVQALRAEFWERFNTFAAKSLDRVASGEDSELAGRLELTVPDQVRMRLDSLLDTHPTAPHGLSRRIERYLDELDAAEYGRRAADGVTAAGGLNIPEVVLRELRSVAGHVVRAEHEAWFGPDGEYGLERLSPDVVVSRLWAARVDETLAADRMVLIEKDLRSGYDWLARRDPDFADNVAKGAGSGDKISRSFADDKAAARVRDAQAAERAYAAARAERDVASAQAAVKARAAEAEMVDKWFRAGESPFRPAGEPGTGEKSLFPTSDEIEAEFKKAKDASTSAAAGGDAYLKFSLNNTLSHHVERAVTLRNESRRAEGLTPDLHEAQLDDLRQALLDRAKARVSETFSDPFDAETGLPRKPTAAEEKARDDDLYAFLDELTGERLQRELDNIARAKAVDADLSAHLDTIDPSSIPHGAPGELVVENLAIGLKRVYDEIFHSAGRGEVPLGELRKEWTSRLDAFGADLQHRVDAAAEARVRLTEGAAEFQKIEADALGRAKDLQRPEHVAEMREAHRAEYFVANDTSLSREVDQRTWLGREKLKVDEYSETLSRRQWQATQETLRRRLDEDFQAAINRLDHRTDGERAEAGRAARTIQKRFLDGVHETATTTRADGEVLATVQRQYETLSRGADLHLAVEQFGRRVSAAVDMAVADRMPTHLPADQVTIVRAYAEGLKSRLTDELRALSASRPPDSMGVTEMKDLLSGIWREAVEIAPRVEGRLLEAVRPVAVAVRERVGVLLSTLNPVFPGGAGLSAARQRLEQAFDNALSDLRPEPARTDAMEAEAISIVRRQTIDDLASSYATAGFNRTEWDARVEQALSPEHLDTSITLLTRRMHADLALHERLDDDVDALLGQLELYGTSRADLEQAGEAFKSAMRDMFKSTYSQKPRPSDHAAWERRYTEAVASLDTWLSTHLVVARAKELARAQGLEERVGDIAATVIGDRLVQAELRLRPGSVGPSEQRRLADRLATELEGSVPDSDLGRIGRELRLSIEQRPVAARAGAGLYDLRSELQVRMRRELHQVMTGHPAGSTTKERAVEAVVSKALDAIDRRPVLDWIVDRSALETEINSLVNPAGLHDSASRLARRLDALDTLESQLRRDVPGRLAQLPRNGTSEADLAAAGEAFKDAMREMFRTRYPEAPSSLDHEVWERRYIDALTSFDSWVSTHLITARAERLAASGLRRPEDQATARAVIDRVIGQRLVRTGNQLMSRAGSPQAGSSSQSFSVGPAEQVRLARDLAAALPGGPGNAEFTQLGDSLIRSVEQRPVAARAGHGMEAVRADLRQRARDAAQSALASHPADAAAKNAAIDAFTRKIVGIADERSMIDWLLDWPAVESQINAELRNARSIAGELRLEVTEPADPETGHAGRRAWRPGAPENEQNSADAGAWMPPALRAKLAELDTKVRSAVDQALAKLGAPGQDPEFRWAADEFIAYVRRNFEGLVRLRQEHRIDSESEDLIAKLDGWLTVKVAGKRAHDQVVHSFDQDSSQRALDPQDRARVKATLTGSVEKVIDSYLRLGKLRAQSLGRPEQEHLFAEIGRELVEDAGKLSSRRLGLSQTMAETMRDELVRIAVDRPVAVGRNAGVEGERAALRRSIRAELDSERTSASAPATQVPDDRAKDAFVDAELARFDTAYDADWNFDRTAWRRTLDEHLENKDRWFAAFEHHERVMAGVRRAAERALTRIAVDEDLEEAAQEAVDAFIDTVERRIRPTHTFSDERTVQNTVDSMMRLRDSWISVHLLGQRMRRDVGQALTARLRRLPIDSAPVVRAVDAELERRIARQLAESASAGLWPDLGQSDLARLATFWTERVALTAEEQVAFDDGVSVFRQANAAVGESLRSLDANPVPVARSTVERWHAAVDAMLGDTAGDKALRERIVADFDERRERWWEFSEGSWEQVLRKYAKEGPDWVASYNRRSAALAETRSALDSRLTAAYADSAPQAAARLRTAVEELFHDRFIAVGADQRFIEADADSWRRRLDQILGSADAWITVSRVGDRVRDRVDALAPGLSDQVRERLSNRIDAELGQYLNLSRRTALPQPGSADQDRLARDLTSAAEVADTGLTSDELLADVRRSLGRNPLPVHAGAGLDGERARLNEQFEAAAQSMRHLFEGPWSEAAERAAIAFGEPLGQELERRHSREWDFDRAAWSQHIADTFEGYGDWVTTHVRLQELRGDVEDQADPGAERAFRDMLLSKLDEHRRELREAVRTHDVFRLIRPWGEQLEEHLAQADAWVAGHPTDQEPTLDALDDRPAAVAEPAQLTPDVSAHPAEMAELDHMVSTALDDAFAKLSKHAHWPSYKSAFERAAEDFRAYARQIFGSRVALGRGESLDSVYDALVAKLDGWLTVRAVAQRASDYVTRAFDRRWGREAAGPQERAAARSALIETIDTVVRPYLYFDALRMTSLGQLEQQGLFAQIDRELVATADRLAKDQFAWMRPVANAMRAEAQQDRPLMRIAAGQPVPAGRSADAENDRAVLRRSISAQLQSGPMAFSIAMLPAFVDDELVRYDEARAADWNFDQAAWLAGVPQRATLAATTLAVGADLAPARRAAVNAFVVAAERRLQAAPASAGGATMRSETLDSMVRLRESWISVHLLGQRLRRDVGQALAARLRERPATSEAIVRAVDAEIEKRVARQLDLSSSFALWPDLEQRDLAGLATFWTADLAPSAYDAVTFRDREWTGQRVGEAVDEALESLRSAPVPLAPPIGDRWRSLDAQLGDSAGDQALRARILDDFDKRRKQWWELTDVAWERILHRHLMHRTTWVASYNRRAAALAETRTLLDSRLPAELVDRAPEAAARFRTAIEQLFLDSHSLTSDEASFSGSDARSWRSRLDRILGSADAWITVSQIRDRVRDRVDAIVPGLSDVARLRLSSQIHHALESYLNLNRKAALPLPGLEDQVRLVRDIARSLATVDTPGLDLDELTSGLVRSISKDPVPVPMGAGLAADQARLMERIESVAQPALAGLGSESPEAGIRAVTAFAERLGHELERRHSQAWDFDREVWDRHLTEELTGLGDWIAMHVRFQDARGDVGDRVDPEAEHAFRTMVTSEFDEHRRKHREAVKANDLNSARPWSEVLEEHLAKADSWLSDWLAARAARAEKVRTYSEEIDRRLSAAVARHEVAEDVGARAVASTREALLAESNIAITPDLPSIVERLLESQILRHELDDLIDEALGGYRTIWERQGVAQWELDQLGELGRRLRADIARPYHMHPRPKLDLPARASEIIEEFHRTANWTNDAEVTLGTRAVFAEVRQRLTSAADEMAAKWRAAAAAAYTQDVAPKKVAAQAEPVQETPATAVPQAVGQPDLEVRRPDFTVERPDFVADFAERVIRDPADAALAQFAARLAVQFKARADAEFDRLASAQGRPYTVNPDASWRGFYSGLINEFKATFHSRAEFNRRVSGIQAADPGVPSDWAEQYPTLAPAMRREFQSWVQQLISESVGLAPQSLDAAATMFAASYPDLVKRMSYRRTQARIDHERRTLANDRFDERAAEYPGLDDTARKAAKDAYLAYLDRHRVQPADAKAEEALQHSLDAADVYDSFVADWPPHTPHSVVDDARTILHSMRERLTEAGAPALLERHLTAIDREIPARREADLSLAGAIADVVVSDETALTQLPPEQAESIFRFLVDRVAPSRAPVLQQIRNGAAIHRYAPEHIEQEIRREGDQIAPLVERWLEHPALLLLSESPAGRAFLHEPTLDRLRDALKTADVLLRPGVLDALPAVLSHFPELVSHRVPITGLLHGLVQIEDAVGSAVEMARDQIEDVLGEVDDAVVDRIRDTIPVAVAEALAWAHAIRFAPGQMRGVIDHLYARIDDEVHAWHLRGDLFSATDAGRAHRLAGGIRDLEAEYAGYLQAGTIPSRSEPELESEPDTDRADAPADVAELIQDVARQTWEQIEGALARPDRMVAEATRELIAAEIDDALQAAIDHALAGMRRDGFVDEAIRAGSESLRRTAAALVSSVPLRILQDAQLEVEAARAATAFARLVDEDEGEEETPAATRQTLAESFIEDWLTRYDQTFGRSGEWITGVQRSGSAHTERLRELAHTASTAEVDVVEPETVEDVTGGPATAEQWEVRLAGLGLPGVARRFFDQSGPHLRSHLLIEHVGTAGVPALAMLARMVDDLPAPDAVDRATGWALDLVHRTLNGRPIATERAPGWLKNDLPFRLKEKLMEGVLERPEAVGAAGEVLTRLAYLIMDC